MDDVLNFLINMNEFQWIYFSFNTSNSFLEHGNSIKQLEKTPGKQLCRFITQLYS